MEILLGVQNNINHFYDTKRKIDNILLSGKITITNRYKLDMLKKQLCDELSDILSKKCDAVLSTSFYMQVNDVESRLLNLLSDKKELLESRENKKNEALKIVKEIVSLIYSIDILNNSIHIRVNSDDSLLKLKNEIENLVSNDKKLYALNYVSLKLEHYKIGLMKLIDYARMYKLKTQMPLDKKNNVLEILNEISTEFRYSKNRKYVFVSDNENENNTESSMVADYIREYESIFAQEAMALNVQISSFYNRIKDLIYSENVSNSLIEDCTDFIVKKYYTEISNIYKKISLENHKLSEKIKKSIANVYTYDGITILENLLVDINSENKLPAYLENSKYKKYIEDILYDFDISIRDDVEIYSIIDELNDCLIQNFDINKYLDLSRLNNSKIKQVSEFRQYYIKLLEDSKKSLIQKYILQLEDYLKTSSGYIYNTKLEKAKIEKIQNEIDEIEEAISYINDNYRKFDKQSLKLYIDTLEEKYKLESLYKSVMKKKSHLSNLLKSKKSVYKENVHIGNFIENEDLKNDLIKNITKNVLKNTDLIDEIMSYEERSAFSDISENMDTGIINPDVQDVKFTKLKRRDRKKLENRKLKKVK